MNNNWFKDWFASEYYLQVYQHRNNLEADRFIQFILDDLKINKNSKILDAACGAGRHLSYLRKNNFNAFGFDLSLPLLKVAKKSILNNCLINADIRFLVFKQKFDYIFNLFTSFGYFESDAENFKFFKNAKNFLTENGIIVFDYFNSIYLKKHLVPESSKKVGNLLINESRIIQNNRVEKKITLNNNEDTKSYVESVKLYSYFELKEKFEKIGFKIVNQFGNYKGEVFNIENSERIILYLLNEKS